MEELKLHKLHLYRANQYISLKTNGSVVKESLSSTWANQNYVTARRVL